MSGYVELHCHSNFSFLDGASHVEELVVQAQELGYPALALTDHNGVYGAMEFALFARERSLQPITGAEVTLNSGRHLTLLTETHQGYGNLCRLLTRSHLDNPRGNPQLDPALLAHHADGLIALSGCPRGEIPSLIAGQRFAEARKVAIEYARLFGEGNFFIELQQNLIDGDAERLRGLLHLARELGLPVVATNNVHYHIRDRYRLQDTLVAIRHRTTLEESHRLRRPNSEFHLKSADEMREIFSECPEAISNTLDIAERCRFDLSRDLDYRFPSFYEARVLQASAGELEDEQPFSVDEAAASSDIDILRDICLTELDERYKPVERATATKRLEEELALIEQHGLAGFFLIYHDILQLAREVARDIFGPQRDRIPGRGRGSSVGSIVCYLVGLSPIDPLKNNLFLGRFLNDALDSLPDIDLDFSREVREQLIQRMYEHFGHAHVALICSFPTYRMRSAIREIGKALGLPAPELARLAKLAGSYWPVQLKEEMERYPEFRERIDAPLWRDLIDLADQIRGFPRHISQHVGGMIISSEPIAELVPLEHAADGRVLCQWDKDSCDDARMVKIDFLALGMLSLVEDCLDEILATNGKLPDLSQIDYEDEAVYDMICAGDTVGVFQIESRAQMQTLPRTKPRSLDDLTAEVAIIRPGPIVGGAINPYITRRQDGQPVSYDHEDLRAVLEETHGVILYQEQIIEVIMKIAGMTAGQADQLRRTLSRKNSKDLLETFRDDFYSKAQERGIDTVTAGKIFGSLLGFAEFGFPKSHAAAFALLAYQSAWLKYHYPAHFVATLLNAQPMGFYSPEVIVRDATRQRDERRVTMLPPDIAHSRWRCHVEDAGQNAVRTGLRYVRGLGEKIGKRIEESRDQDGPFRSLREFCWRVGAGREAVENLIQAGAFDAFGLNRRELLWQLGLVWRSPGPEGTPARQIPLALPTSQDQVTLPDYTRWERVSTEFEALGFSPHDHPIGAIRQDLAEDLVVSVALEAMDDGVKVRTAGMVVCRQRPETARGFTFLTLEDERGLTNLIVRPNILERFRAEICSEPFLIVTGALQRRDGTTNVIVQSAEPLPLPDALLAPSSHDYH